jgi:hypothetical protein
MTTSLSYKKPAAIFLMGMLALTSTISFPQRAHAFGALVHDPINYIVNGLTAASSVAEKVKGYSLDPIAWMVAKAALQSVVKSTINWINSGFNGSPAFVTDLQQKLLDVGDAQAHQFLGQLSTNLHIKSPFQGDVASAVGKAYFMATNKDAFFIQNPYDLDTYSPNSSAYLKGDFTQGGLNALFAQIRNPANSSLGAAELARNALFSQVASQQDVLRADYQAGNGFISWRGSCKTPGPENDIRATLSTDDNCLAYNVQTPGSVIHDAATKAFGSGVDTLVSAHTFDEIVNSLLAQMLSKVASSAGLIGLSQSSASSGGRAYFDQTDSSLTTVNSSLNADLAQIISKQVNDLQTYKNEWGTINSAAQAARAALSSSACSPNAQATIAAQVQPIIDQSTAAMSQADTASNSLNDILSSLKASGGDPTKKLSSASDAYAKLLSSGTIPTNSDTLMQDAKAQSSTDPTADGSPSLVTQMNQLTQSAQTCSAPH